VTVAPEYLLAINHDLRFACAPGAVASSVNFLFLTHLMRSLRTIPETVLLPGAILELELWS